MKLLRRTSWRIRARGDIEFPIEYIEIPMAGSGGNWWNLPTELIDFVKKNKMDKVIALTGDILDPKTHQYVLLEELRPPLYLRILACLRYASPNPDKVNLTATYWYWSLNPEIYALVQLRIQTENV